MDHCDKGLLTCILIMVQKLTSKLWTHRLLYKRKEIHFSECWFAIIALPTVDETVVKDFDKEDFILLMKEFLAKKSGLQIRIKEWKLSNLSGFGFELWRLSWSLSLVRRLWMIQIRAYKFVYGLWRRSWLLNSELLVSSRKENKPIFRIVDLKS